MTDAALPPEQLLRALLLQMLYSIRSERLLIEELDYSVLYRWFVGLSLDNPIWDATTFTKNRDRLLAGNRHRRTRRRDRDARCVAVDDASDHGRRRQAFGWMKAVGLFRKLRHRGGRLVGWMFTIGAAAYNLVRWRNLIAQRA
ncbi:MAG: hypothetical protein JWL71_704 [Acidobacteria bacterium]|nr:hypothetical protein [Acidobacteriota bacterium]